jgi:hypothetical protein
MYRDVIPACRTAIMLPVMDQSRAALGQEPLFHLHGGDAAGDGQSVDLGRARTKRRCYLATDRRPEGSINRCENAVRLGSSAWDRHRDKSFNHPYY